MKLDPCLAASDGARGRVFFSRTNSVYFLDDFIENIDINGVVCKMYEENMMPCNDKREGKKRFEQLKSRLL